MEVIKIDNVWKSFKVYHDKGLTLKERLLFRKRNHYENREVLRGIDLSINKGDVVGLIGENGSGKSTLLKLLTKIMYPEKGGITITGKVSSLLELGAGFHPDLSGRENVYTNASIFGLTKKEIDERLAKIIEFSELEEFMDNPVRTYSSGMYMRLAFSVAINVDADILLIDEILAVGDANFQAKCFDKLRELKRLGTTIVIVTHDLGTIEKFCTKAVWLSEGKLLIESTAAKVVDVYLNHLNNKRIEQITEINNLESASIDSTLEFVDNDEVISSEKIDTNSNRFGLKFIEIKKAILKNERDIETKVLKGGEQATIEIYYKINKPLTEYVFGMGFYDLEGRCLYGNNTKIDRMVIPHTKSEGIVLYKIKKIPLLTGKYILQLAIVDENGTPMDFYREYCIFDVINEDRSVGYMSINHEWEII